MKQSLTTSDVKEPGFIPSTPSLSAPSDTSMISHSISLNLIPKPRIHPNLVPSSTIHVPSQLAHSLALCSISSTPVERTQDIHDSAAVINFDNSRYFDSKPPCLESSVHETNPSTAFKESFAVDDIGDKVVHHYVGSPHYVTGKKTNGSYPVHELEDSNGTVRFVRKRAYASARQAGCLEQLTHEFSQTSPNDSAGRSYQLRPALPQSSNISPQNTEPKITHLPRRRSTRTRLEFQTKLVDMGESKTTGSPDSMVPNFVVVPRSSLPSPPKDSDAGSAVEDAKERKPLRVVRPDDCSKAQHLPPRSNVMGSEVDCHPWNTFSNGLHSDGLWAKAGDAYRCIALADERISHKLANKRNLTSCQSDLPETTHGLELGPNKENRCKDSTVSQTVWISPDCRKSLFPKSVNDSDLVDDPTNPNKSSANWSHIRSLCTGLRPHRSETCINRDSSGGFFSRQCLCKILTVGGSLNKRSLWKSVYLSITETEIKFIKASTAFRSTGRMYKNTRAFRESLVARASSLSTLTNSSISTDGVCDSRRDSTVCQDSVSKSLPLSTSCLILPITGLMWYQEDLPDDLPTFPFVRSKHNSKDLSPLPDIMDPSLSGISKSIPNCQQTNDVDRTLKVQNNKTPLCYRIVHANAGVELLLVFPDEGLASTCLRLCEIYGGKRSPSSKSRQNNPNDFLDASLNLSANGTADSEAISHFARHKSDGPSSHGHVYYNSGNASANDTADTQSLFSASRKYDVPCLADAVSPSTTSGQLKLKDRRHRRLDNRLAFGNYTELSTPRNLLTSSRTPKTERHIHRIRPQLQESFDSNDSSTASSKTEPESPKQFTVEKNFSSFRPASKVAFLQSIKQFLSRPGNASHSVPHYAEQSIASAASSNLQSRLSVIFGNPPEFCDLDQPGPIFGCALEKQTESPDISNVPVILHSLVVALEAHGLLLKGLYRRPGRQRVINQFICASNLMPKNVEFLLSLDAWNEPYALCGLVKAFLRRIPVRLLDLVSWEPMASLVPDKDSTLEVIRLAYLLLSIRVKLWKMASHALNLPKAHLVRIDSAETGNASHRTIDFSESINESVIVLSPTRPNDTFQSKNAATLAAKWRWATLNFVVRHLRQVVSYERDNEVTYKCAAICFGPVLFDDTVQVDKLNVVLENLLQHWPWLTDGIPSRCPENLEVPFSCNTTLAEAISYLEDFKISEYSLPLDDSFHFGKRNVTNEQQSYGPSSSLNRSFENDVDRSEPTAFPRVKSSDDVVPSDYVRRHVKSLLYRAFISDRSAYTAYAIDSSVSSTHTYSPRIEISGPHAMQTNWNLSSSDPGPAQLDFVSERLEPPGINELRSDAPPVSTPTVIRPPVIHGLTPFVSTTAEKYLPKSYSYKL